MKRITYGKLKSTEFYKLPKFLFEGKFKYLSFGAKVLYSLLYDRLNLSLENESYKNSKDEVYIIYTVEQMCEKLNCSNKTVIKYKKELLDLGLLEEQRQYGDNPNLLFLTDDEEMFDDITQYIDLTKIYFNDSNINKYFIEYLKMRQVENIKTTSNDINILIDKIDELGKDSPFTKEQILLRAINKKHKNLFKLSNHY